MKAWRQHKTNGPGRNRRAAKRAGSTNRNAFFAGGSSLLRALLANVGLIKQQKEI